MFQAMYCSGSDGGSLGPPMMRPILLSNLGPSRAGLWSCYPASHTSSVHYASTLILYDFI